MVYVYPVYLYSFKIPKALHMHFFGLLLTLLYSRLSVAISGGQSFAKEGSVKMRKEGVFTSWKPAYMRVDGCVVIAKDVRKGVG